MILRLWSGFTTPEHASAYDDLLDTTVAPGIASRRLEGLRRFEVWTRRRDEEPESREVLTAMWFEDLDAVARFTGGDLHESVVPPAARELLTAFDAHSRHYELRARHV